jgi:hypothetical protein
MLKYLFIMLVLYSCASLSKSDYEKEKKEILILNEQQRENHFIKNARGISDLSSDKFLLIDGGKILTPSRESQLKNFESYFNAVNFIKWDDIKEPEVRFSKDASIAYVAVEKIVILNGIGASGREVTDTSHYAWMSVYKKTKTGWELDAIASTRKLKS